MKTVVDTTREHVNGEFAMPVLIPTESLRRILADALRWSNEAWLACLYTADITPSESDTAATYIAHEADFDGYKRARFDFSTTAEWQSHGEPAVIYGYFVIGEESGSLVFASQFPVPQAVSANVRLCLTPAFGTGVGDIGKTSTGVASMEKVSAKTSITVGDMQFTASVDEDGKVELIVEDQDGGVRGPLTYAQLASMIAWLQAVRTASDAVH